MEGALLASVDARPCGLDRIRVGSGGELELTGLDLAGVASLLAIAAVRVLATSAAKAGCLAAGAEATRFGLNHSSQSSCFQK